MTDKKKGSVVSLRKDIPLPSDEPEVDQRLVDDLEALTAKAKKGEINFITYITMGSEANITSSFVGKPYDIMAVAQALRFKDQEWQEMIMFPAWYGEYDDE